MSAKGKAPNKKGRSNNGKFASDVQMREFERLTLKSLQYGMWFDPFMHKYRNVFKYKGSYKSGGEYKEIAKFKGMLKNLKQMLILPIYNNCLRVKIKVIKAIIIIIKNITIII